MPILEVSPLKRNLLTQHNKLRWLQGTLVPCIKIEFKLIKLCETGFSIKKNYYSALSASIGSILDAFHAGYNPDTRQTTIPMIIP